MPIRARRLFLALGRARYLAQLDLTRTPYRALRDGLDLWMHREPSWAGDLANALHALPVPVRIDPADLLDVNRIKQIMVLVEHSVDVGLQRKIDGSVKCLLLQSRLELGDNGSLVQVTRRRRHYLTLVTVPNHRKALTRLLLSNHCLSIETLRYKTRYRDRIPRHLRLCRFCLASVEDEAHALLGCNGNEQLVELRDAYLREVFAIDGTLRASFSLQQDVPFLRSLVASRKTVALLAKYVYQVLGVFREAPQWIPDGFALT